MRRQLLLSGIVVHLVWWCSASALPAVGQQAPQALDNATPAPVTQAPRVAMGPGPSVRPPSAPEWAQLSPKHQEYLDQLLAYWEHKSNQIQRYRCTFKRWEYDPVFGPPDKCQTYSEGVIKYASPDKGLFRVDQVLEYQAPKNAGEQPTYQPPKKRTTRFDHWVCDGTSIFQFDYEREQLVQYELPPEMRGRAIVKGPLPFLFNAKADDIQRRFWLHVITPQNMKGKYWLEGVPKTAEDAADFQKIHIIIDEADYLPEAMVLFSPSYVPGKNEARTTFQFNDREVNFSVLAEQLNLFHREFYEPKLPLGWKKVVNRAGPMGSAGADPAIGRASVPDAGAAQR